VSEPITIGSTDEARQLVEQGIVDLTDPALDRPVNSMSDREIAEETLRHQRAQRDMITKLVSDLMASPLGAMMVSGASPLQAMLKSIGR
jgi:hypothetical protein